MQIRDVIGAAIVKTLDCVEPACAAGHVGKVAKTWSAKTTLTPIIPGHGVSASMPPCSRDYPPGRHCWTPATSTTACCCPSWCTVWTTTGIRCSDHQARNFSGTPTPTSQRSSRPCANTGRRPATRALADRCHVDAHAGYHATAALAGSNAPNAPSPPPRSLTQKTYQLSLMLE